MSRERVFMRFLLQKIILMLALLGGGLTAAEPGGRPMTLADPTVFFFDGVYYLYGTSRSDEGFEVYTSTDLKDWRGPQGKRDGLALRKGDAFGQGGFWAPQVFYHEGLFYMAYTADGQIAIATSDSPLGPFAQKTRRKISGEGKQIDPFVFFDGGKIYLYHVRLKNGNRLHVAEMKSDLSDIKASTVRTVLAPDQAWENTRNADWPVMEGPTVLKRAGRYWLFYSANDFRSPDYAVGYAVAPTPLGPWEKPSRGPLIDRKLVGAPGPGHGDLFQDTEGNWRYVFHVHASEKAVHPRRTAVLTVRFAKENDGGEIPVAEKNSLVYWQAPAAKEKTSRAGK